MRQITFCLAFAAVFHLKIQVENCAVLKAENDQLGKLRRINQFNKWNEFFMTFETEFYTPPIDIFAQESLSFELKSWNSTNLFHIKAIFVNHRVFQIQFSENCFVLNDVNMKSWNTKNMLANDLMVVIVKSSKIFLFRDKFLSNKIISLFKSSIVPQIKFLNMKKIV